MQDAIRSWFRSQGLDPVYGPSLPASLESARFDIVEVAGECHLCRGGSDIASVIAASTEALWEKYVATGVASGRDVGAYLADVRKTDVWTSIARLYA